MEYDEGGFGEVVLMKDARISVERSQAQILCRKQFTWITWSNLVMESLSRIDASGALAPKFRLSGVMEPRSLDVPEPALSSSLRLFVLMGFVRGELAGDAVTGDGRGC